MKNKTPSKRIIARRIAKANGIPVEAVIAKFWRGVRKSAVSCADFFWPDSDISLSCAENFSGGAAQEAVARRGAGAKKARAK